MTDVDKKLCVKEAMQHIPHPLAGKALRDELYVKLMRIREIGKIIAELKEESKELRGEARQLTTEVFEAPEVDKPVKFLMGNTLVTVACVLGDPKETTILSEDFVSLQT